MTRGEESRGHKSKGTKPRGGPREARFLSLSGRAAELPKSVGNLSDFGKVEDMSRRDDKTGRDREVVRGTANLIVSFALWQDTAEAEKG